ncbi:MAG TPA: UDP-glucose 4-epimerase GalE [Dongiaceae bacterium]|jgi:UDP-glucose 4-epimerase|nr:UDP-glucose 4-epimerase GalE [Dongiaceae bacterium]
MRSVVVTGGAGYIGSHMVQALARAGYRVVVLDNLSTGHAAAVHHGELVQTSLADRGELRALLFRHRPCAIFHFAASCQVKESVENPIYYYKNNVSGTLNLLEAALEAGVPRFIFSSTAAVYGEPETSPITEKHPAIPINPYGWSKLHGEAMVADAAKAYGMQYMIFRYFNAAGADSANRLGEDHRPETHLIPLALRAAILESEELQVYGNDYPTADGTCIRDYVHVLDLADAHLRGLEHLEQGGESAILNLGTEHGTSVLQILEGIERVTALKVPHRIVARRPGDPAVLVASPAKAKAMLDWEPKRDLDEILRTAYDFMRRYPEGYPEALGPVDPFGPQPQEVEAE